MRSIAAVLAASLAVAVLASCGKSETPLPARQLRIATGLDGGVYRVYGSALASVLNDDLQPMRTTAVATEGSVDNLQRLDDRRAGVAFTLADSAFLAKNGKSPFAHPVKIMALARLYDDYLQIIVRRDSNLRRIADLAGKRVSIGAKRSGTALQAKRILRMPTMHLRGSRAVRTLSLTLKQSTAALAAGRIDALFWSGGLPTDAINDLRKTVPIRLIGLPAGTAARLDPDLYTETQIPLYVYGKEGSVRTVIASNLLVVRQDLPAEIAFRITRALFEHKPELVAKHPQARRLNPRSAIAAFPLDLHPGAKRWYRQERR
jgi:TRAP transporter TAXI family solute receptor